MELHSPCFYLKFSRLLTSSQWHISKRTTKLCKLGYFHNSPQRANLSKTVKHFYYSLCHCKNTALWLLECDLWDVVPDSWLSAASQWWPLPV